MSKIICVLKVLRNVVLMWSISLGFLMLMTFISYKFRLSSSVIYFMIILAYILGGITGGLFSSEFWTAIFSSAGFIGSIKLIEAICGKGDVYHQNFIVYILIIIAAVFGFFVKR